MGIASCSNSSAREGETERRAVIPRAEMARLMERRFEGWSDSFLGSVMPSGEEERRSLQARR